MQALTELFSQGGPVMYFIAAASVLAWYLAVRAWCQAREHLAHLERMKPRVLPTGSGKAHSDQSSASYSTFGDGPCDRFALDVRATRLEHAVWTVAALAAVLPLLGLLGTVLGMLMSFEVIQVHGTGQPRLLAGGIGQALMTTQAGLWTALPVLFFHHITRNRVRLIRREMDVLSHAASAPHGGSRIDGDVQEGPKRGRMKM